MHNKHWADLSASGKIGIVVGGAFQIGLLVAGLWDLAHRTATEIRGDRRLWLGLMFVNWIGPIAYFAYGRKDSPLRCCRCMTEKPVVIEEDGEFGGPAVV